MSKKIVVFAAHPDDETLGCGGTIARRKSEGYEVIIVVLTDGRHAFSKVLGICSDPTPEELKEIRREEVKRAARVLGVPERNLTFLDFEDSILENFSKEAEEKIIPLLKKNSPSEIYYPYKKDANPDHTAANQIVTNAANRSGLNSRRYQYSIMHKWSRIGPKIDALLSLLGQSRICVDISNFLPLKKRAIEEFKSEIEIISNRQPEPILKDLDPWLKDTEIFYLDE